MLEESGVDYLPRRNSVGESGSLGVGVSMTSRHRDTRTPGLQGEWQTEVSRDHPHPGPPPSKGEENFHQAELDNLRKSEIGDCDRCPLRKGRTNLVFGVGNPNASLMFVGEGPGADEDRLGEPFVGKAGQLLTKMIEAMGLKRPDVYIANVVKCRPPGNRNPEPVEITTCLPYLKKQIDIINPKVIVCLGKVAAHTLLQTEIPITKLRGEFSDYGDMKIIPTYHPAYLLRNPAMKKAVWEDLKKVMALLGLSSKSKLR